MTVKKYLSESERCVVEKGAYLPVKTPMTSIIASKPLEVLAMDFTQLEPASDGRENVWSKEIPKHSLPPRGKCTV